MMIGNKPFRANWRAGLIAGACVAWLFVLMIGYYGTMHFIDGVSVLDSRQKLERFMTKSYQDATLPYDSAQELGTFSLTSKTDGEVSYHVWALEASGCTVLYCANVPFDGQREVHVAPGSKGIAKSVIADFAPNTPDAFVLYDAGSPIPFICMEVFLTAFGAALFVFAIKKFPKQSRENS